MFTWVGSKFDAILNTLCHPRGDDADFGDFSSCVDCHDLVGWLVRLGGPAQRSFRHGSNLPMEGFQDQHGAGYGTPVLAVYRNGVGYGERPCNRAWRQLSLSTALIQLPSLPHMCCSTPLTTRPASWFWISLRDAGITRLDLLFAAIVCSIGNVVFICVALFVVTLAKVFLTFVIAVGARCSCSVWPGGLQRGSSTAGSLWS